MRLLQKSGGLISAISVGFALIGCVALPKPPNTPICLYDNASKDDKSDRSPNFKCIAADGTEFKVQWQSTGATNMVCTPHDDYVRLNAYYKKLFDIFEREFLNKATTRR